jgi:hypothetical protein
MTIDAELIRDPTAFQPLSVVATRETEVGYELPPLVKRMSLDKSRIYQGWPEVRNRHTDYEAAHASGLSEPNINGGQIAELFGEILMKFFGTGYLGGALSVAFLNFVALDDEVTAHATVAERIEADDRLRLVLKLTAENHHGVVVAAGTASGVVA